MVGDRGLLYVVDSHNVRTLSSAHLTHYDEAFGIWYDVRHQTEQLTKLQSVSSSNQEFATPLRTPTAAEHVDRAMDIQSNYR